MSFYLALDAVGTKANYVLTDDTRELARGRSGTIKRMRTDAASAAAKFDEVLPGPAERTGVPKILDFDYLLRLVLRPLLLAAHCSQPAPIAFAGSIMERVHPVRTVLIADVQSEFPNIRALYSVVERLYGALWRARSAGQATR